MEKTSLQQLLDKQSTLAQKALALQNVNDYKDSVEIKTDIDDEDYFNLYVRYGAKYGSNCHEWEAHKSRYADDKSLQANEDAYAALEAFLDEEIAKAEKRANIVLSILALFKPSNK